MTCDIESVRRIVSHCQGDGRRLADYDPSTVLFVIRALLREVDMLRMDVEWMVP